MECCAFGLDLFEPGIVKYLGERRVSGVCERIRPTLATVRDESQDGHGLHIPRRNSDPRVIDPGRGAEQDHSVPCSEIAYPRFQLLANGAIAASRVAL